MVSRPDGARDATRRVAVTVGLGIAGGTLAGAVGRRLGAPWTCAVVGAANGVLAGWHRIHDLRRPRALLAFVLDSTWSLPSTAGSLVSHAIAWSRVDRGRRSHRLSVHRDRHVYATGLSLRRGYALTVGNVVSGAGDVDGDERPSARRRALVDRHEDLHVWQARWLGPIYLVAYASWMVVGAAVGTARWLRSRRNSLFAEVEAAAYVANPFEWWAYSRDGNWPPRGALVERVWQRPLVSAAHAPQPKIDDADVQSDGSPGTT